MHEEELQQLQRITDQLKQAFLATVKQVHKYDDDYKEVKKYIADFYNEIDTMEIFSSQQTLNRIDQTEGMALKEKQKLEKLLQSPYFSRIDFVYEGDSLEDKETFYIGRFSFSDDNGEILIHDWRAPISNMYYEFETGPAYYEALDRIINGEIVKRRQIKITNGQLEYVLENDMNINDSILQQELSKKADERMKTIVATIQKEQNAIVRNDRAHTLVIQGVAGSGKTSIALHRIAYLLYKHRDRLTPERVMIISPNKVFSSYISTVLPELGEEPIRESHIVDLARSILPRKYSFITAYKQSKHMIEQPDSELATRVSFKSTMHFYEMLTQFIAELNLTGSQDLLIHEISIPLTYLQERFKQEAGEPINKRFELLADDILRIVKSKNRDVKKLLSKNEVIKRLKKRFSYQDALSVYKAFYSSMNKQNMFQMKNDTFEFADVFPYLICLNAMEGIDKFNFVDHLVIDEMQDYTPVQYAVLQKLFRCPKTILGDFGQSLNPFAVSSTSSFRDIFLHLEYVELTKSYRSSYEIIDYAKRFLPKQAIEAIERHGQAPQHLQYTSLDEMIQQLKARLLQFEKGEYKTCGIICKTDLQAELLEQALASEFVVHKLDEHTALFKEGITISSVQLAKGLEFDVICIPFVDKEVYHTDFDKGLLYIACTRALHELTVFHSASHPSPLV